MDKEIKIQCKGAATLPLDEFQILQGELKSLSKENYQKLRQEIIDQGFSFTPHIWIEEDKGVKKHWLLDGTQRIRTVRRMVEFEDFNCPDIPISFVYAYTYDQAKRKLLAAASQYGEVEETGLLEYIQDMDITPAELPQRYEFKDLDLQQFIDSNFEDHTQKCEDALPVPPIVPKSKLGDIYKLGEHRLMCGDCGCKSTVEALMSGSKADLLITDPPYGVNYVVKNAAVHGGIVKNAIGKQISGDTGSVDDMYKIWSSLFSMSDHFSDKASYYVFSPQGGELMMMMQAIHQSEWALKHSLIWVKQNFVLGRCDYHYQHEPVLYGWKKKGTHNWYGDRSGSSVLNYDRPFKSDLHPTTKPLELIKYLMGNSSKKGDAVVDLFGGSGTTLIASEETGRKCFMMELDPIYVDVIINRWENLTGNNAELLA